MKKTKAGQGNESQEDSSLAGESICSRCGMAREEWTGNLGKGVLEAGETYCCQGCADDAGCTCDYDRAEPEEEAESGAPRPGNRGRER